ncbi:pilin [bacterium]|nr:pilin [bacterium]
MSKNFSKYLTATGLSLAVAGLVVFPSIIFAEVTVPTVNMWGNELAIQDLIMNVVNTLFNLVAPLCILMIIVGGLYYMTAGGDERKAGTGLNFVKYALVGLIVTLMAGMLLSFVSNIGG